MINTRLLLVIFAVVGATSFAESPRSQVTIENWDKCGAVSHWAYTHVSEVFPSAVIRRGGTIVDLPIELRPEIGGLKLNNPGEPEQTLDQFVNNGAVDGCVVLRGSVDSFYHKQLAQELVKMAIEGVEVINEIHVDYSRQLFDDCDCE